LLKTNILMQAEIGKDLVKARKILEEGDLVSIPTETVYGLAANAFDQEAVLKIFQVKNRPTFDPLIVHTYSIDKISEFVQEIPKMAEALIGRFSPGPLTLLLKKTDIISDLVTSGSELVAIRVPDHPLTLELLAGLPFPVAAPSANPFGYISPTTAAHVNDQLGRKIKYILDGGLANVGIESTIVGFEDDQTTVYRLGGISVEAIEKVVGKVKIKQSSSKPSAPGMLTSHYAPTKKVILGGNREDLKGFKAEEIAALNFTSYKEDIPEENQLILSSAGNVDEAAKNLFSFLRKLDQLQVKVIIAELVPDKGLGRAINDRLKRAAATKKE
jgi:L-threonylcarbamoyladenylate synthase